MGKKKISNIEEKPVEHLQEDYEKGYRNRLAAHMDELKWLYYELYRSNEQSFPSWKNMRRSVIRSLELWIRKECEIPNGLRAMSF